ncbi:carboxypeptidase regulatory-like domain-containing protein, partial [Candidatus Woesearchaeota archaeon]|nr:carboxypeptidase regulatory-like domain-containing protein [Candidatus Woesearchaeota archaeon]
MRHYRTVPGLFMLFLILTFPIAASSAYALAPPANPAPLDPPAPIILSNLTLPFSATLVAENAKPLPRTRSIDQDSYTVTVNKSSYNYAETIGITTFLEHWGPVETVTERLYLGVGANYYSIGTFSHNLNSLQTQFWSYSLPASSVADSFGQGTYLIYGTMTDQQLNMLSDTSSNFYVDDGQPDIATISGTIRDEFGNTLVGAGAEWTTCAGSFVSGQSAGPGGQFSFSAPAPASYKFRIIYNGYTYNIPINGYDCFSYNIGNYNLNDVYITTKARLSGTVESEFGNPLTGAIVKWTDCSDNPVISYTTGSNGAFTLTASPGSYKLKVTYTDGYTRAYSINGNDCNSYGLGLVTLSDPLVFQTKASLSGSVQDELGNALSGVQMQWTDCSNNVVTSSTTGSGGLFILQANPSNYKLKGVYNGYTYTFTSCDYYNPVSYTLTNPLTITTRSTLTGTIQDEFGNPINGAVVKWTDCSDNLVTSYTTGSSGSFSLTALAENYKLKVVYNGFTYTFNINGEECTSYSPGSVSLTNPLTITTRATITGTLHDEDGANINGATAALTDCSGNTVTSTTTGSSGTFSLTALPGNYKLKFTYRGFTYTLTGDPCSSYGVGTTSFSTITLTTKATVTGVIQNEFGNPINGAVVKWTDCSDNLVTSYTTGSSGSFSLTALAGSYKLKVVYNGKTYPININGQECNAYSIGTTSFSNPIVIYSKAHLAGTVKWADGTPATGAVAQWTTCSDSVVDTKTADANGNFDLAANPGSYKFRIKATYQGREIIFNYVLNNQSCLSYDAGMVTLGSPIELPQSFTLYGYLKDLSNNPLPNKQMQLYTCSDSFVKSATTANTGYFSLGNAIGSYKILIDMGGFKIKLQDSSGNDCLFLLGDINVGTLNVQTSPDCSVFNYLCYQDDIKLYNCFWDAAEQGCRCYGQQCNYGCTDGAPQCDTPQSGTINVDVKNVGNTPLPGARIYMDQSFKGTTDAQGKYSLTSASFGYRTVKVNCPDDTTCSTQQVYVDNIQEYTYFNCQCTLDSDGDGWSDADEHLVGTDPFNAAEGKNVLYNPPVAAGCYDMGSLFSFGGSPGEVVLLLQRMETLSVSEGEEIINQGDVTSILEGTGISLDRAVEFSKGISQAVADSSAVYGFAYGSSALFIVTDKEAGVTSIYTFTASCTGQVIGTLYGAGQGLYDDANLIYNLLKGIWYYLGHRGEIGEAIGGALQIITEIPSLVWHAGDILHDVSMDIFEKGENINFFSQGSDNYLAFQLGFFGGFITGYLAEQILLLKGIGEAIRAFKAGATFSKVSGIVENILTRLTTLFGGRAANVLRQSTIWATAQKWTSELAQNGAARVAKYLDDTTAVNNFFEGVADTQALATRVESIAASYGDDIAEALVKSERGKAALKAA